MDLTHVLIKWWLVLYKNAYFTSTIARTLFILHVASKGISVIVAFVCNKKVELVVPCGLVQPDIGSQR